MSWSRASTTVLAASGSGPCQADTRLWWQVSDVQILGPLFGTGKANNNGRVRLLLQLAAIYIHITYDLLQLPVMAQLPTACPRWHHCPAAGLRGLHCVLMLHLVCRHSAASVHFPAGDRRLLHEERKVELDDIMLPGHAWTGTAP